MIKKLTYKGSQLVTGQGALGVLQGFLERRAYDRYYILCDEHTSQYCLPVLLFHCEALLSAEIIEFESGESHKNMETCMQVWLALQDQKASRNCLLINLGGGVVTDMGGFIASVYKRGVNFINIPTTLLAMVDASVGGKNGVDLNGIKNQIGTVAQPALVLVDPVFLDTLPERQVDNGIAEIIKIALISDAAFYKTLAGFKSRSGYLKDEVISHAIGLKKAIVKKDPKEKHLRKSLNFGHSIGHALESASLQQGIDVLHGEAVAAGMIMESYLAYEAGCTTKAVLNATIKTVQKYFTKIAISKKTEALLLEHIRHDKKNEGHHIVLAIAPTIGSFNLLHLESPAQIPAAIRYYQNL